MSDFVIWGRSREGGEWESYHPPHADVDQAVAERLQLERGRPDREYVICLERDPAPRGLVPVPTAAALDCP